MSFNGAWHAFEGGRKTLEKVNPPPPMASEWTDLRGDLEAVVDWYNAPWSDRQAIAAGNAEVEGRKAAARSMGLKADSVSDQAAMGWLTNGNGAGYQQQAVSPEAQQDADYTADVVTAMARSGRCQREFS